MVQIAERDREFLVALGGVPCAGDDWRVLKRRQRVLLMFPSPNRPCAKAAGGLYSPQSMLAKLAHLIFFEMPFGWKLLPKCGLALQEKLAISQILKKAQCGVAAMLFGNAEQVGRRLLILSDESAPRVFKLGAGVAKSLVLRESAYLEMESRRCDQMLSSEFCLEGETWASFAIPFLREDTASSVSEIIKVLMTWWQGDQGRMSNMPSWQKIVHSAWPQAAEIRWECEGLKLYPTRIHGDLAPWNIRKDKEGKLVFLDWEEGRSGDVPGWDLVHFIFQQSALVERASPEDTAAKVRASLQSKEVQSYLEQAGWKGKEDLLFRSYLVAMATEEGHIRAILDGKMWEQGK